MRSTRTGYPDRAARQAPANARTPSPWIFVTGATDPATAPVATTKDVEPHDRGGPLPHHSTDGSDRLSPSPFDVSDLRARHRHLKIRYRPSKRHRRRAAYLAYLAAGGPPY